MKAILPGKTTDEWLALLNAAHIPTIRVNDLDDLLDDPQLKASGLFEEREHQYIEVKPPVRFSAHQYAPSSHAVTGQHTQEVASELGGHPAVSTVEVAIGAVGASPECHR